MKLSAIRVDDTDAEHAELLDSVVQRARALGIYNVRAKNSELAKVLSRLEIPVLNTGDVKRYMREKVRPLFGHPNDRITRDWITNSLENYSKPVPVHVLSKAVQIKEAFPDAQFIVHEYRESHVPLDPFIEVKANYNSEGYFFEYWEEATFKGKFEEVKLSELPEVPATPSKFPY